MKIRLATSVLTVVSALLGGCIVQSFHPFYQPDQVVKLPAIVGAWSPRAGFDSPQPTPWVFTENDKNGYQFLTYEHGVPGKLEATFFRLGTNLFCDFTADDPERNQHNPYWILHVRPMHTVARVNLTTNRLEFIPLNEKWFSQMLTNTEIAPALPRIVAENPNEAPLMTATPQQWTRFLSEHAMNTNAFPPQNAYRFEKHAAP